MAAVSDAQEAAVSAARARTRQNKKVPFLINRENFRLLPNTPLIRALPNYMLYDGKVDADLETRRAYVENGGGIRRTRITNTEAETFDIGKATKDELVSFAMSEYSVMLDPDKDIRTLRKEFMAVVGDQLS